MAAARGHQLTGSLHLELTSNFSTSIKCSTKSCRPFLADDTRGDSRRHVGRDLFEICRTICSKWSKVIRSDSIRWQSFRILTLSPSILKNKNIFGQIVIFSQNVLLAKCPFWQMLFLQVSFCPNVSMIIGSETLSKLSFQIPILWKKVLDPKVTQRKG